MFLLCMFFLEGGLFSGGAPRGDGSAGKHSAAEGSSAQFGPLYGKLESAPSGSIIIMEDDTPDVLIRYAGRGSAGRRLAGASSPTLSEQTAAGARE